MRNITHTPSTRNPRVAETSRGRINRGVRITTRCRGDDVRPETPPTRRCTAGVSSAPSSWSWSVVLVRMSLSWAIGNRDQKQERYYNVRVVSGETARARVLPFIYNIYIYIYASSSNRRSRRRRRRPLFLLYYKYGTGDLCDVADGPLTSAVYLATVLAVLRTLYVCIYIYGPARAHPYENFSPALQ